MYILTLDDNRYFDIEPTGGPLFSGNWFLGDIFNATLSIS